MADRQRIRRPLFGLVRSQRGKPPTVPRPCPFEPPDMVLVNRIDAAITALPDLVRQVFILHRFEDLNYVRIARRLGIGTDRVEQCMAEALCRLHRAVEDTEGEPS